MLKKSYLREPYSDIPPIPFGILDYALCAIVFLLMGIASNAQIAGLIVSVKR
jgi:hypothetical protein